MTSLMMDLLVRVVALLLVATLLLFALRRSSASLRALTWTAVLGGTLVLPAITLLAPAFQVGVLPARAEALIVSVLQADPPVPPAAEPSVAPTPTMDASSAEAAAQIAGTATKVESGPATPATPATPDMHGAARETPRRPILPVMLLGAWIAGALLLLVRLGVSHARLARLVRAARPAIDAWRPEVDAVRSELGIARGVAVRISPDIEVPAVAGVLAPTLLLPLRQDWSRSERRDVILHELAHVARWDALSQLVSQLACAAYWFVPLTWYAAREAAALREQACDNVVLNAGTRPSTYAERLLTLSRTPMLAELEPVALAMARPARIHGRVMRILDPNARRARLSRPITAAVCALALAFVAVFAVVEPVAAQASSSEAPTTSAPAASSPTTELASPPAPRTASPVPQVPEAQLPLATVVTNEAPLPQKPSPICPRGVESNSVHRGSDNGEEVFRLSSKGPGCEVTIRVEGKPTFNEEFTDVVRIDGRGTFEFDVRQDGVRRELRLRDEGGRISREWRVDGRERPYDAEAAAWFGRMLIAVDRATAFAVDVRLPKLLARGGVSAVLDETREMPSDYARSTYYIALSRTRRMSTQELVRVLDQEAEAKPSDYYATELLKGVAKQGLSERAAQASVMRIIERMESDYYKSESVKMLSEAAELTPDQLGRVLTIVTGMKSDHYISEMLKSVVERGTLDAPKRRVYLTAARSIKSDHYLSEALKGLLANGRPAADEGELFMAALSGIESDHYQGEVLNRLLEIRELPEADLLRVERAARSIESDYNQAEVLRRIGAHASATSAVRDAVYSAAESLGRYYREEVRRSLGR